MSKTVILLTELLDVLEGPSFKPVSHYKHTVTLKFAVADQHKLAVGGMQSSSNQIVSAEITIDSTHPLLWTTHFRDNLGTSS